MIQGNVQISSLVAVFPFHILLALWLESRQQSKIKKASDISDTCLVLTSLSQMYVTSRDYSFPFLPSFSPLTPSPFISSPLSFLPPSPFPLLPSPFSLLPSPFSSCDNIDSILATDLPYELWSKWSFIRFLITLQISSQILEFKIIAAETSYLLVQSEDSLSWESAEKLLIKSLGLFYDVRRLKQFSKVDFCSVRTSWDKNLSNFSFCF